MLRSRCQSRFEVRMISSDLTPRHRLGQIAPFVGVPPSKSSASGVLRAIRAGTERLRAGGFDRLVNLRSGQKSLPTTSLLACRCTDQRSVRTFPSCGTRWLEACSFCGRVTPVHSGDSGHMTMSMTRHKTTRLGSVLLATFGFSALALSGAARADQIHFERGVGSNQEWKQMYRVAEPNMHDVLQRYGGHWDRFVTVTADAGREIVTHNDWVPDHGPGSVVAFVDQLYEIEDYQVLDGVIHLAYEPYGPPDNGSGPGLQPGGDGPSGPADPEPEDRHIPKGSESTSSEPYRVSRRPHCLGGWGLWDVQVGFLRKCANVPSGWSRSTGRPTPQRGRCCSRWRRSSAARRRRGGRGCGRRSVMLGIGRA